MVGTYFLYLDRSLNPIEFDCPLEPFLYFNSVDSFQNPIHVTTIKAVFEPTGRRTLLLWLMFVLYGAIMAVSIAAFLVLKTDFAGFNLIQMLPFIDVEDVGIETDLGYIMCLMKTNRRRVKLIRFRQITKSNLTDF